MFRRKLVLIGAGSAVFTQRLVADIIPADEADEADRRELALVDTDPATLDAVGDPNLARSLRDGLIDAHRAHPPQFA